MRMLVLLSSLFLYAFTTPASAQVESYTFDKAHTQILFFVNHLGFSHSSGRFLKFDGGFTFDRTQPANSSIDVTIDTNGLEMNDQKWNDHLKNQDFFNVAQYPTMTFKSTKVEVTGENTANIAGDLTLLGVTKPVTLVVTHNKSEKHAFSGKYVSGFSATAMLKRSDFGMTYGLPMVGDEVKIMIEVEGERIEQGGEGTGNK
ncbi:MAG: YceI family protein [Alphaproteobacteria bacterium]|nr:YceI family protein [Alphaproteobacteria bacterium]